MRFLDFRNSPGLWVVVRRCFVFSVQILPVDFLIVKYLGLNIFAFILFAAFEKTNSTATTNAGLTCSSIESQMTSFLSTIEATALNEQWHYGFGYWHECQNTTWNCVAATRISSPGAYGAYPFWDRSYGYIGIVARQSASTGTFPYGIAIERAVHQGVTWLLLHSH